MKTMDEWNKYYDLAKEYLFKNDDLLIPRNYIVHKDNEIYALGEWVASQRRLYSKGALSTIKINMLEQIEMVWNTYDYKWNVFYSFVERHYNKYGNIDFDPNYTFTYKGKKYNPFNWINGQKQLLKNDLLKDYRKHNLEKLGLIKSPCDSKTMRFDAEEFIKEHEELDFFEKEYIHSVYDIKFLSNEEERKLVKNLNKNNKNKLINSLLKYVVLIAEQYTNDYYSLFELIGMGNEYLFDIIDNYQYDYRVNLKSYVNKRLNYFYNNIIKETDDRLDYLGKIDESNNYLDDEKVLIQKEEEKELFKKLKKILSEREYDVICKKTGYGYTPMTSKEISEKSNISTSAVYQAEGNAIKKMKKYKIDKM